MRLWCNKYFEAVQNLVSKYERFGKKMKRLQNENVYLRTRNEKLSTTKAPKKYLSQRAKKKRLIFLLERQRRTSFT